MQLGKGGTDDHSGGCGAAPPPSVEPRARLCRQGAAIGDAHEGKAPEGIGYAETLFLPVAASCTIAIPSMVHE